MPGSWKVLRIPIYKLISFLSLNSDDFVIKPDEEKLSWSLSVAVLL